MLLNQIGFQEVLKVMKKSKKENLVKLCIEFDIYEVGTKKVLILRLIEFLNEYYDYLGTLEDPFDCEDNHLSFVKNNYIVKFLNTEIGA